MLDKAIKALVPKAKFALIGTKLIWNDDRPQPTQEQIEAKVKELEAQYEVQEAKKLQKTQGVPYTALSEDNISFTKDDAMGMLQVKAAFELGLPETIIEFSNGTKLAIKAVEFPGFAKWFVEKRNSFFI